MPGTNFIEGMNSNLNTSAIVEAIINAEKGHVRIMEAQQVERTNKITTYNSISAMLLGLKAKTSLLTRPSSFNKTQLTVSNESFATAAVSGDVASGLYRISIDQLARNHQVASQGFADDDTTRIGTGTFKIKVGDAAETTITLDATNNTLSGLKDAINAAGAGVTASVVNDGSSSNSYRLLITSKQTGLSNQIVITNNLTGGTAPDFVTASFDSPETLTWSSAASSTVSLGSSASYSGTTNKTYTFTVQGSGTQTVGSGDILVNWTDGTNSGTVTVSTAGAEVSLTGDGADGLTLNFAAGDLVAGDTLQVQTFAPVVQQAQDARISIGSSDGGGSPITVTSSNNTVENVIPGVTLTLKRESDAETPDITIRTEFDTVAVRSMIDDLISQYNEVNSRIDDYLKYDTETEEAGILIGDTTLLSVQHRLKALTTTVVEGIDSGFRTVTDIGIRTSTLGQLNVVDSSALTKALEENLSDVIKLFADWGESDNSKITFLNSTFDSKKSPLDGYEIDITQAAAKGYLQGTELSDPSETPLVIDSDNNTFKIVVDSRVSEDIQLTEKTYNSWEELVAEIQTQIDNDANIGSYGVSVSYSDLGETGILRIDSGSYGSNSTIKIQAGSGNSAFTTLGLAEAVSYSGKDVEGTINGEKSDGTCQILAGNEDNETTAGIILKFELTAADLGSGAEANLTFTKGVASQYDALLDSLTKSSEGMMARRSSAIQKQIDYTQARIEYEEARLAIRKEAIYKEYIELEKYLEEMNAQTSYLNTQLDQLKTNWKQ
jgi:flagellar hook-associated protein 2